MSTIHIILFTVAVFLFILILVGYRLLIKTNHRILLIEKSIQDISAISQYFPDFIEKGEGIKESISEEFIPRQNMPGKLIPETERVSQQLGIKEEKNKKNKLDKETINKILILVNQGFTPVEIAPKLNIPLAEIELVIKLRQYLSMPIKERL